jgi:metallo-beta-lactamase family protein
MIPAFSLERTQMMLYMISNFMEEGKLPRLPVFLDSPLAIKATEVYTKHAAKYFKQDVQQELKEEHDIFRFPQLTETPSREDSEDIAKAPSPKIIIAGAGMSHGGRIGGWERRYLPDPSATLLLVGYQAPGSPGRLLQDGVKKVRLGRDTVQVKALVRTFSGWSAHADKDQLLSFAQSCVGVKTVFCALGEPESARYLAQRLHEFAGMKAIVPTEGERWGIGVGGVVSKL